MGQDADGGQQTLLADLVFEGGGVKGIGLAGAYRQLSDSGYQSGCVAGASAGSIMASLVAAGYTGPELALGTGVARRTRDVDQASEQTLACARRPPPFDADLIRREGAGVASIDDARADRDPPPGGPWSSGTPPVSRTDRPALF